MPHESVYSAMALAYAEKQLIIYLSLCQGI